MLHQIVYDQGSTIFEYLADNGLTNDGQAYLAANSLMEELDQGNIPQQHEQSQNIEYEEFFKGVSLLRLLNLFFGRTLVKDYTLRILSPNQYLKEKTMIVAGCVGILALWWILPFGLNLAILALCGLGVLLFSRLAGDSIVRLISGLQHPDSQLLEVFTESLKQIKEAEYVERSLLHSTDPDFDELLKDGAVKEMSTYNNLWIEQRSAISSEIRHILTQSLSSIRSAAAAHPQYLTKYEVLQEKLETLPNHTLSLESLKKSMELLYLLHRQLKEMAVGLLLSPKISNFDAYSFVAYTDRIRYSQKQASELIRLMLYSRQQKDKLLVESYRQKRSSALDSRKSSLLYCLERLNYIRQLMLTALDQSRVDHPATLATLYELSLTELKSMWKLMHQLKEKLSPALSSTQPEDSYPKQLSSGMNTNVEEAVREDHDYELIMTQTGREIHFKNRDMDKIADQLQLLLFKKQESKQVKAAQPPCDQRIRFNFITELKGQIEGVILE